MATHEPTTTYLELRGSTETGEAVGGLSHSSDGLFLLHVLELAASGEPCGAVTIVHDAGDHGGRYVGLATALAERGFAAALPDLRGHGRSEGERGHSAGLREVLRDLGDVQDHLAYRLPEAPKVLIGQGLGALYALAYAAENPGALQALVLVAPVLDPSFEPPPAQGGLKKLFGKKSGPTTPCSIGWGALQLTADAASGSAREGDELCHDVITLRALEQAAEIAARYVPELSRLTTPVLVLHGSDDPVQDVAHVRAAAGAAPVEVFDGLRHDLLHETRGGEVTDRLVAWLAATV